MRPRRYALVAWSALFLFSLAAGSMQSSPAQPPATAQVPQTEPQKPGQPNGASRGVPKSLTNGGEYAENIYDATSSRDWKMAKDRLSSLTRTMRQISVDAPFPPQVNTLTSRVSALRKDVGARDQLAAMTEANEITGLIADLSGHFQTMVPVQVAKLDYLGRKLQIESAQKDLPALKATASAIRGSWNEVKPKLEHKGAVTVERSFESIVASLEAAQGVHEFSRLAQKELDEVDNLEKVFTK